MIRIPSGLLRIDRLTSDTSNNIDDLFVTIDHLNGLSVWIIMNREWSWNGHRILSKWTSNGNEQYPWKSAALTVISLWHLWSFQRENKLVDSWWWDMVEYKHEMDQMAWPLVYQWHNTTIIVFWCLRRTRAMGFTCNSPNDDRRPAP